MELRDILVENNFDLVVDYPNNTGNQLSKAELRDICQVAIGQDRPNNNVRFIVRTADDKRFVVYYTADNQEFLYEKLTRRVAL